MDSRLHVDPVGTIAVGVFDRFEVRHVCLIFVDGSLKSEYFTVPLTRVWYWYGFYGVPRNRLPNRIRHRVSEHPQHYKACCRQGIVGRAFDYIILVAVYRKSKYLNIVCANLAHCVLIVVLWCQNYTACHALIELSITYYKTRLQLKFAVERDVRITLFVTF